MNDLTRDLIKSVASKNRAAARENGDRFAWEVDNEYWLGVMSVWGWKIWLSERDKLRESDPGQFDSEGNFLNWFDERPFSERVEAMIHRMIADDPELQLTDYGNYPRAIIIEIEEEETRAKAEKRIRRRLKLPEDQAALFDIWEV